MEYKYYDKFEKIHKLLNEYEQDKKFKYNKYTEYTYDEQDIFFYTPNVAIVNDLKDVKFEWREDIVARLDVTLKALAKEAIIESIRFDITYSERVRKYRMYVSYPTFARCVDLYRKIYKEKEQDELIKDIQYWLDNAKCKKRTIKQKIEQLSFI